ncbi:MAG TPA: nucleotide exchange factor GrpE [Vicinamibacterales bacterium]|nr:nucleotide exchange factor GrpE [Vicinamibacterales bacterium]
MADLKVTDRRWWARGEADDPAGEEPNLKPTYLEELEARLSAKDGELHELLGRHRAAVDEFEQARARLRKEMSKDVERGRRSMLVSFLEVLDNLDRALEAAGDRDDPVVQGVSLVRQQFLATLAGFGVERLDPLGQPFDPARHEAVSTVEVDPSRPDGLVCGVIKPGYLIAADVLRPAMVAVARA